MSHLKKIPYKCIQHICVYYIRMEFVFGTCDIGVRGTFCTRGIEYFPRAVKSRTGRVVKIINGGTPWTRRGALRYRKAIARRGGLMSCNKKNEII